MEDAHQIYLEDEIRRNVLGIKEMVEISLHTPYTASSPPAYPTTSGVCDGYLAAIAAQAQQT